MTNKAGEAIEIQRLKGQTRSLARGNAVDLMELGRMIYDRFKAGGEVEEAAQGLCEDMAESAARKMDEAAQKAGDMAGKAAQKTSEMAEKAAQKTGDMAEKAAQRVGEAAEKAADKLSDVADNLKKDSDVTEE